jgi:uncharacterized cupin superfamily protein
MQGREEFRGTGRPYVLDRVDAEGFEPFVVDGVPTGEIRWLRAGNGQPPEELEVGIWRSDPATYDYPFLVDETFHVIEGTVSIELPDSGDTVELRAGDVAYFSRGTRSIWRVTETFRKFVITPPS